MPFRRKRTEPTKRVPKRGITRRNLIRGAGAVIAGSILGCRTIKLTEEQIQDLQKYDELQKRPPHITELRTGSSVKKVLERSTKENLNEIILSKRKPGRLHESTIRSSETHSYFIFPRNTTRSSIHTHRNKMPDTKVRRQLSNMPSSTDILSLIQDRENVKEKFKLRYMHVAVIDIGGKVAGYYSMGLGKQLRELLSASFIQKFSKRHQRLRKVIENIKRVEKAFDVPLTHEEEVQWYKQAQQNLAELKKLGLMIRTTAMPGYKFKDGYFQHKI